MKPNQSTHYVITLPINKRGCYIVTDQLNSKEGGEEVGPLELQITTLQKQIKDTEVEKEQLEQYWLKKQSHLVRECLVLLMFVCVPTFVCLIVCLLIFAYVSIS